MTGGLLSVAGLPDVVHFPAALVLGFGIGYAIQGAFRWLKKTAVNTSSDAILPCSLLPSPTPHPSDECCMKTESRKLHMLSDLLRQHPSAPPLRLPRLSAHRR